MPVFMIALIALVAFGLIGLLLFTAGALERNGTKKQPQAIPSGKHSR